MPEPQEMSERELLEMIEHNSAVTAERFDRLARQIRDLAVMTDGQMYTLERRDHALRHAMNFVKGSTNINAVNHASVLGIAQQFDAFLKDGTVPDMVKECKEMASLVWTMLQGAYPAEVIEAAKKSVSDA